MIPGSEGQRQDHRVARHRHREVISPRVDMRIDIFEQVTGKSEVRRGEEQRPPTVGGEGDRGEPQKSDAVDKEHPVLLRAVAVGKMSMDGKMGRKNPGQEYPCDSALRRAAPPQRVAAAKSEQSVKDQVGLHSPARSAQGQSRVKRP